jgi:20S proteasome alpha/beta subunit
MAYNGGSIVAMKGKKCIAIASDLRYGITNENKGLDEL